MEIFFAYIDLGSGSYIMQLILAGILGGIVTLKIYWTRFKGYFKKLLSGKR